LVPLLPDELNNRSWLRGYVRGDKCRQNLIGHSVFFIGGEQRLLLEIKTVLAVEIADRPMGLATTWIPLASRAVLLFSDPLPINTYPLFPSGVPGKGVMDLMSGKRSRTFGACSFAIFYGYLFEAAQGKSTTLLPP